MRFSEVARARISEEIARRAETLDGDSTLSALTIVVKVDRRTGLPGLLLWRPEYERNLGSKG